MVERNKNIHITECVIFGIYCAALIIQNILAVKTINIFIFTVTTGIMISPVVFILQDVTSEVFGFRHARTMILCAYLMNFILTLLTGIAMIIPSAEYYTGQEAFEIVFSTTPRIVIASFVAYCVGSLTNAKIMTTNKEKHSLFIRAILSTVAGQLLDNFLFALIAFYGTMPIKAVISMAIGATILETVYEIVFYPITKKIIYSIRNNESNK